MNADLKHQQATFRRMDQSTRQDWEIIAAHAVSYNAQLADRVLAHLKLLIDDYGGFPVSRHEHSLQTATLLHKAGKSEEDVVCGLLHDIGDTLGSYNHADIAAAILEPFVSEQNHWVIKHHAIFQGYYFFHHMGANRNMRDAYRDHEYASACEEFCRFDQAAFDPTYVSLPLEAFEPMVRRVFAAPQKSIYLTEQA